MNSGVHHRGAHVAAALLCGLVLATGAAQAQIASPASPAVLPKEEKTGLTTLGAVELGAAGSDVDAELTELMQRADAAFLKAITLIGRGRGVAAPQGTLGQVVWYGIRAEVKGEERKAGLAAPLKSAFLTGTTTLGKGQKLEATGDLEALKAAARKLLGGGKDADQKDSKAGKGEEKANAEARPANRQVSAGGGAAGSTGSLPPYQPLAYPEKGGSSGSSSAEVEMVTSEGCQPRALLDQGVVYPQSKLVTMKEGVIVRDGQCTDSFQSLPIQKSFAGCEYAVDIEALKAWPQYRPYYVNAAGEPVYVTDCMQDANAPADIVKDGTACSPIIDLEKLVATRASELVYTSMSGGRVVVASCRPDEGDTLPITATADGCGYRHDMPANQSFKQTRKVYVEKGVSVAVSACADDGAAIPHVLDTGSCQPQVDYVTKKVTPLARRLIQTEIGLVTIAECAPSPELAADLFATSEGCERIFVHNLTGDESYRTERFYYEQAGTRAYVGACVAAANAAALPHQLETTGWQNDDTARTALPQTRVYITWNGEKFEVSSAQVRPDAVAVPYSFVRVETVPNPDAFYYEACNKYVETNKSDTYARPDGTQVGYVTGPGAPQGPTNACVTQSVEMSFGGVGQVGTDIYCWYGGRAIKLREDGETVYGAGVSPGAIGSTGWYLVQNRLDMGGGEYKDVGYTVGSGGALMYGGSAGGRCYAGATDAMKAAFQAAYGL
ncbi:hypothetical protein [Desertibaculum subflavum]|uniref:hypothetical protein n=1 Tax=Desertibaculum subflavum TaxID=2268458 RepID=UPI0013C49E73